MKKAIFGFGLLSAALAFGGVSDKVIAFSTPGEDKYADGSVVRDGEFYALVWTKNGSEFKGFDTDGKSLDADSKILLKAPVATGGHCPFIQFEIDEKYYLDNRLAGGAFAVYLLDTRKYKAGADGVLVKDANGNLVVESWGKEGNPVNGYGNTGAVIDVRDGVASAAADEAVAALQPTAPAADGANAKFDKIELKGGNVYLYVTGLSPTVRYDVQAGDAPNAINQDLGQRYGSSDGEMIIVRPAKVGGEFFNMGVVK